MHIYQYMIMQTWQEEKKYKKGKWKYTLERKLPLVVEHLPQPNQEWKKGYSVIALLQELY